MRMAVVMDRKHTADSNITPLYM